jgi:hypothetical protein
MRLNGNSWQNYLLDSKRSKSGGPVIRSRDSINATESEVAALVRKHGGRVIVTGGYYVFIFNDKAIRILA